jgi:hypothetical protein
MAQSPFIESNREQMSRRLEPSFLLSMLTLLCLVVCPGLATAGMKASYLYNLSNFTGTIPYSSARVVIDKQRNEISVLYQNLVRVFNQNGMEVYRFGDDFDLGLLVDIAVDGDGNLLTLSYGIAGSDREGQFEIIRFNFRGEPIGGIELKNLPEAFSKFSPGRIVCRGESLYLVDLFQLRVVVTDLNGSFKKGYELIPLFGLKGRDSSNTEIGGFSVEDDGSMLFTIPVLFTVYRLYPDGNVTYFGKPGGAPGRFNIVGGVVLDGKGNYLVVDRLKCTVQVFDSNYNFLAQFGFRGFKPGNLIAPDDIAIDSDGRIYVTQNGRRGVSVYRITYE